MNLTKNFLEKKYSKYLLLLLALAFVLSSLSGIIFMTNKYNIVVVDNIKVNINEYINILNNKRQLDYNNFKTKEEINFLNSKQYMINVVNEILFDKIILKDLEDLHLEPDNNYVLNKIVNDPVFLVNKRFDIDKFNNSLKMYGIKEKDYIDLIKERESRNTLFSFFSKKINYDYIANALFNYNNFYKDVIIFKIKKNQIKFKDNINFSDEELKKYYDNNINNFIVPESLKIDYIILNKNINKDKIEENLLISSNIKELAEKFNVNVNTFGFINKDNDIFKIKNIEELLNYNVNDMSNIKVEGNDYVVYSVVAINKEKIETFKESKNKIKIILQNEDFNKKYKSIISNNIDNFKKNNFNQKYLINSGFVAENVRITRKYDKYGLDFTESSLNKNISDIFIKDDYILFSYTKKTGLLTDKDEDFVDKEEILYNLERQFYSDLQENYLNYLEKNKYKIKVNYKLLDLINKND